MCILNSVAADLSVFHLCMLVMMMLEGSNFTALILQAITVHGKHMLLVKAALMPLVHSKPNTNKHAILRKHLFLPLKFLLNLWTPQPQMLINLRSKSLLRMNLVKSFKEELKEKSLTKS